MANHVVILFSLYRVHTLGLDDSMLTKIWNHLKHRLTMLALKEHPPGAMSPFLFLLFFRARRTPMAYPLPLPLSTGEGSLSLLIIRDEPWGHET